MMEKATSWRTWEGWSSSVRGRLGWFSLLGAGNGKNPPAQPLLLRSPMFDGVDGWMCGCVVDRWIGAWSLIGR